MDFPGSETEKVEKVRERGVVYVERF